MSDRIITPRLREQAALICAACASTPNIRCVEDPAVELDLPADAGALSADAFRFVLRLRLRVRLDDIDAEAESLLRSGFAPPGWVDQDEALFNLELSTGSLVPQAILVCEAMASDGQPVSPAMTAEHLGAPPWAASIAASTVRSAAQRTGGPPIHHNRLACAEAAQMLREGWGAR